MGFGPTGTLRPQPPAQCGVLVPGACVHSGVRVAVQQLEHHLGEDGFTILKLFPDS